MQAKLIVPVHFMLQNRINSVQDCMVKNDKQINYHAATIITWQSSESNKSLTSVGKHSEASHLWCHDILKWNKTLVVKI